MKINMESSMTRRIPLWLRTLGLILWAAIVANGIVAVFGLYWGVL